MKKVWMAALVVVLGLSTLSGCRTATGKSAGAVVDDAVITSQVKARLGTEKASTLTRVDVDTENGVVYLNGVVDSADTKARAEQIARSEEGVSRVVNNLQVQPSR